MLELTEKNCKVTHLWILQENQIKIAESKDHEKVHAEIFGDSAWDIPTRGYFDENQGIVTCHHYNGVSKTILNRIERAFDKAGLVSIYFKGKISK